MPVRTGTPTRTPEDRSFPTLYCTASTGSTKTGVLPVSKVSKREEISKMENIIGRLVGLSLGCLAR